MKLIILHSTVRISKRYGEYRTRTCKSFTSVDFKSTALPIRLTLLKMEPEVGFEPTTCALQMRCSTSELFGQCSDPCYPGPACGLDSLGCGVSSRIRLVGAATGELGSCEGCDYHNEDGLHLISFRFYYTCLLFVYTLVGAII